MKDKIIWSHEFYEQYRKQAEEMFPELDEEQIDRYAAFSADDDLDFIRQILFYEYSLEKIIIIADLGLWNARHGGYKVLNTIRLSACFYSDGMPTWFVDRYKNLRCVDIHHDGVNYYLYRQWKPGLSDTQKENFLDKVYAGEATEKDISRYTVRIGDLILNALDEQYTLSEAGDLS